MSAKNVSPGKSHGKVVRVIYGFTLILLLAAICTGGFFGMRWAWRKLFPPSPLVMTPVLALQELKCPDALFPEAELRQAGYDVVWVGERA